MTTRLVAITPNMHAVYCNATSCQATFTPTAGREQRHPRRVRNAAEQHGWQVRPASGPGYVDAPDLCPQHREAT